MELEYILISIVIISVVYVLLDYLSYLRVDSSWKTKSRYLIPTGGLYLFLKHGYRTREEEDEDRREARREARQLSKSKGSKKPEEDIEAKIDKM